MSETTHSIPDVEEMATDTLRGDVRDIVLGHIRDMQDPWSKMSEKKQAEKIEAIDAMASDMIRRAVRLLAQEGKEFAQVQLKDFTLKDGVIKGKYEAGMTMDRLDLLATYQGKFALIVFTDADGYMGETNPAKPDPDEPAMFDESGEGDDGEAGEGGGTEPEQDAGDEPADGGGEGKE